MDNTTLSLKDIHLPEAVSWWPPAAGWWIVSIIFLITLSVLSVVLWRRLKRTRLQRIALDEVRRLKKLYVDDDKSLLQALSKFLRQLAMHYYGRERVAHLTESAWLEFLDKSSGSTDFSQGIGRAFASGPYNREQIINSAALIALARLWIKKNPPLQQRVRAIT